jgi:4a-hydroxytetrahydrobiopterin dehydratase
MVALMAASRSSEEEIVAALGALPGWTLADGRLHCDFRFDDFSQAIGFMMRVALVCEQLDHHPNWSNVYGRVQVQLWTHDAGGVTQLDLRLATKMNEIAGTRPAKENAT